MSVEVVAGKVSKSKLVKEAFKVLGLDVSAKKVIEKVKLDHGVEPTESLVNNVKHHVRKMKAERAANRKKVVAPTVLTPLPAVVNEFERLLAVRDFANTVGGLENLKVLVTKLEQLTTVTAA